MPSHDWSRFELRIPIKADRQNIFHAWTTSAGLESWFLRQAVFTTIDGKERAPGETIQPTDHYAWRWHGWSDEVVENGTIFEVASPLLVHFSFGKAGKVMVRLGNENGEEILTLVQDQIPDNEASRISFHIGCSQGWLFYLTNLKSILEGGLDLRNRNVALTPVINS